jgi:DNA gyrase/topoisomerase IV subunit A
LATNRPKIENVDLRNDKESQVEMLDKSYAKSGKVKAYSKTYDKNTTPLYFRNFITLSTCESADECTNSQSMIYFNNKFFVSKMIEMPIKQFNGKGTKVTEYVKRGDQKKKATVTIYEMPYNAGNRFYIPLIF